MEHFCLQVFCSCKISGEGLTWTVKKVGIHRTISERMFSFPLPCRANDCVEIGKTRPPAQFSHDALWAGAEDGRITRSPIRIFHGYLSAHFLFYNTANISHRVTRARSYVIGGHAGCVWNFQRQKVSLGYVADVNIIAQARAVWCCIVMAIDFE